MPTKGFVLLFFVSLEPVPLLLVEHISGLFASPFFVSAAIVVCHPAVFPALVVVCVG